MLQLPADPTFRFGGHVESDDDGRLYDRRTREQLERVPIFEEAGSLVAGEVIRALVVTARALRYVGERQAQRHGLSEVRLNILVLIRHHPDERLTLGQLARALDVSPRTMTSLIDLLERDRLVSRIPHARDRRSVLVQLTPRGRAKVDAVWDEFFGNRFPIFQGFSRDEMVELRHLCYKLMVNLSRTS